MITLRNIFVATFLLASSAKIGHTEASCPPKVNVILGGRMAVTKGVCSIQFESAADKHVYLDVDSYEIQPDRFVMVFDGSSCLAEMVDVAKQTKDGPYLSNGTQLTVVYGSALMDESTSAVNLVYLTQTKPAVHLKLFSKRTCGSQIESDSGKLAPNLKAEEKTAGVCVWQVRSNTDNSLTISVTKFDNTGNNELLIFDGEDCSGANLLWLSSANSSVTKATSQKGQFVILSVPATTNTPFELEYSTEIPTKPTEIPPEPTEIPTKPTDLPPEPIVSASNTTTSNTSNIPPKPTEIPHKPTTKPDTKATEATTSAKPGTEATIPAKPETEVTTPAKPETKATEATTSATQETTKPGTEATIPEVTTPGCAIMLQKSLALWITGAIVHWCMIF